MKSSLWPLQEAIWSRLENDTAIANKVTGVFDAVKDSQKMPYIVIGEDTANDYSTKTTSVEDIICTLHVWSGYNGTKEVKEIMDLILQSITSEPLTVSGFTVVLAKLDYMNDFIDSDGVTRHGVQRFRFIIQNN
jgi:hypothetical protein